jgi:hypothetical protein
MNRLRGLFTTVVFVVCISAAQEVDSVFSMLSLKEKLTQLPRGMSAAQFSDLLGNPETLNKYLGMVAGDDEGWRFLKDIKFRFKTFSTKGDDSLSSLGFSYQFAKDVNLRSLTNDGPTIIGQAVSVRAQGNVAFDPSANPKDFLDAAISVSLFGSHGGVIQGSAEMFNLLNALEDSMVKIEEQEKLDRSSSWLQFSSIAQNHLSTQVYWSFAGTASLESNQKFSIKQYVYGFETSFDVKAWNRTSILASLNVFDWPFAFLRMLSGEDADFSPLGSTIPTVICGIKWVDPNDGDPRKWIDSSGAYYRFNIEAAFRTPVANVLGQATYFQADFRFYTEIAPSAAVVTASLHQQTYFTGALSLANGLFVSYTTGRLPFDARNDQIYELGFQYSF